MSPIHEHYPSENEIDQWVEAIVSRAYQAEYKAEFTNNSGYQHMFGTLNMFHNQYIRFRTSVGDDFYGYWQPALSGPAPLLVHLPGYESSVSYHPELIASGYNVLHINPMGHMTPDGPDVSRQRGLGNWPVLPDTVTSQAQKGYFDWLTQATIAVRWALEQPEVLSRRVSFFGTSQGGGAALLMGSIHKNLGVRCVAADLPFLTNFPLADWHGAYDTALVGGSGAGDTPESWKAIGFVDTLSHAHRLDVPVMLTAGGKDNICPAVTIESLFRAIHGTKSYTLLQEAEHRYTKEFIPLATAWFRLYA